MKEYIPHLEHDFDDSRVHLMIEDPKSLKSHIDIDLR